MRLNPRKRKRRSRRAAGALAGGLAVAGAATATYLVTQRRRATGRAADRHQEFRCACGQEFRVTGSGRHRVFWLPDARPEDPVLDDRCPNCERTLSLQD